MRSLGTPFGVAVLGLLVLAGWAAVSGGLFDGEVARQVRSSSVYVAPGVDLDEAAAAKVIGNRRLVVVFMDRDADLSEVCDDVEGAAADTLVMLFQPGDGEWDHYGCANFPDDDGENFGNAFVAETHAADGADQFVDRPLEAVKVVAVNYDGLVRAGVVPDGARTIHPSAPRLLLAGAAVLTVVGGAVTVFVAGRRLGRLAARHERADEAVSDERASLNAKAAVLARQIIGLDGRGGEARELAAAYADLAADLSAETPDPGLSARIDALTERAREFSRTAGSGGSRRRSRRGP